MLGDAFDAWWQGAVAGPRLVLAIVEGARVIGTSSYRTDAANAVVEIGGTYLVPGARGTAINPAIKRAMIDHAFAAGARRIEFRVDALNARSRAAVLKLGAREEGVLRQDRVTWTGRVRDTVVFGLLAAEWRAQPAASPAQR